MAARRALHCLSFLLLPALLPESMLSGARARAAVGGRPDRRDAESAPYLPSLGAPPLRFREGADARDYASSPPAAAPPSPHLTRTESSVAQANQSAAHASLASAEAAAKDAKADDPSNPKTTPVSILPDTVRPQVQAEDFLPFFLVPEAAPGAGTPPVPRDPSKPAPLPPSTATYTQTPK